MRDIVLVTGRDMPVPETETPLLLTALHDRGVDAAIETWRDAASSLARLVVVRTTWDYTAHLVEFLGWASEVSATTRLINPVEVLQWSSHKRYLLDLAAAGVPVISTTLLPRGVSSADQQAALGRFDGMVVIKPAVAIGAVGALRATARSSAAAAHLALLAKTGDVLVQPFEPGVTAGEMSLLYFGGRFSHAVRKVPATGDFRVHVEYGGTITAHVATLAELALATAAVAVAPGPLAYARVDLVTTAAGPAIMELELIEPVLFLRSDPGAAARFADYLVDQLSV